MTKSEAKGSGVEKEAKDFPPPCSLTHGYRPRCFFDIQINKVDAGRIVFELFSDICPKTSENFRALCTGEKGEGKTTFKPLHYKNTILHRIVKKFILQGGDFVSGDGTGGESIYGGQFKDENFELQHDRPYLLSMANCGPNTNGSQFFITLAASHHLDNVHTVFGHVLSGQDIIRDIENQKVNSNHKPYADIRIAHCGELIKKVKSQNTKLKQSEAKKPVSSSSSSESDSDSSHGKKKHHKRRKSKDKTSVSKRKPEIQMPQMPAGRALASAAEPVEGDLNFIPTVPSTFLMRRSRTPSPIRERRRQEGQLLPRRREPALRTRINMVSKSGKKLRGRGVMRYRTPSPDSSDSESDSAAENDAAPNMKATNVSKIVQRNERTASNTAHGLVPDRRPRRSRSRSFERAMRRRELFQRRTPPRAKDVRHRRSLSPWRRPPRRPRYRSRSRSRSKPKHSRSPAKHRGARNSSQDRKGKFDRHHSESGSLSESSQVCRTKQKKSSQDKAESKSSENVNQLERDYAQLSGKKSDRTSSQSNGAVKPLELLATTDVQNNMPHTQKLQTSHVSDKSENLFPTGINNEKITEPQEMHDDFIATSIEEENIPGYFFDQAKEKNARNDTIAQSKSPQQGDKTMQMAQLGDAVKPDEHAKVDKPAKSDLDQPKDKTDLSDNTAQYGKHKPPQDDPARYTSHDKSQSDDSAQYNKAVSDVSAPLDESAQSGDLAPLDEPQFVDEITKSKEKIGVLQEQIKEFEEFKLKLGVQGNMHPEQENIHKDHLPDANESPEKGKRNKLDTTDVLISSRKKRISNLPDSDSSVLSDRNSNRQKGKGRKKLKKKPRKYQDSSESSITDEDEYDSDDESSESEEESPAEADRDHKKSRKRKHKSKRERNRKPSSSVKNKSTHKKKKYHSDYSSESSNNEYGKRSKKPHKKHQNESSSEYSTDSDYQNSKKKVKRYTKRKDSKRSRKKSLAT